jgi:MFS family permease
VAAASVIGQQFVLALSLWAVLRALFGAAMAPLFVVGEAWINSLSGDAVRGRVVAIYTTSFTLCEMIGPLLTDALAQAPDYAFAIGGAVFLFGLPGIALARDDDASALHRRPGPPVNDHRAAAARAEPGIHVRAELGVPERAEPGVPARAQLGVPARAGPSVPADIAKDAAASWWDIVRTAPTIIAGAALFAAFDNVMLSFLPLFALDRGLTQTRALTAVAIVFLGDAVLQFAAGSLADRFGRARVHRLAGIAACLLLPLLPGMIAVPVLWECYLFVLGGIAGSLYTLAMVSSGERFSGAALLRASGLIALTWNLASSVVPAATGVLMQHLGSSTVTIALTVMAIVFLITTRWERVATAARLDSGA